MRCKEKTIMKTILPDTDGPTAELIALKKALFETRRAYQAKYTAALTPEVYEDITFGLDIVAKTRLSRREFSEYKTFKMLNFK